jgi:hypothetical protein
MMRKLSIIEVQSVSGAGRAADSLQIIGNDLGQFIGSIVDRSIAGVPGAASITGVLSLFGLSVGNYVRALGSSIGYSVGMFSESLINTIKVLSGK